MEHGKIFELLDEIRECTTCGDNKRCPEFLFAKLADEQLVHEHQLGDSFTGRLLARSLAWMAVEETNMMYVIDENGIQSRDDGAIPPESGTTDDPAEESFEDDVEFSPEFMNYSNPIVHHLNETRAQMRDTVRLLFDLRRQRTPDRVA